MKKAEVLQVRNRFQQFMYGRYGMDQLNRFLSTVALIILVVSMFIRRPIVEIIALALLFWCYYRMFSKNIAKRSAENQKYMNFRYRAVCFFKKGRNGGSTNFAQKQVKWKAHQEQKKIYRFYSCPNCSQKVRVPKGKGKICITCPKCRTEFVKRT